MAKNINKKQPSKGFLYGLGFLLAASFVEGGAVMAVELLSAKMIAPYFGSSLYVWSSVLAITMGGLTTGYFVGGDLSEKHPNKDMLFKIYALSAGLVLIMPFTSALIMGMTIGLGLKTGIVISSLVFVFPPLMCFGMVSPMIIRLISDEVKVVGKSAGNIYAVSTIGGIIVTFIFGFYLIPALGMMMCAIGTGVMLGIFPVIYFFTRKNDPALKEATPS